ncbi:zinc-binding dehydrogenase [Hazenella sp. IB182357]|uniref:Zinc-binding dehydrogenase n=1 Tax=Polycladospora coralii TaxID=2771432 RepID=A0A926RV87_9BACL|nr:zinc-binding dehydrogenase [Polycladospora coralii]MBD1373532.1 zinc-binding dehydrogenase [Polycladospora coralii]MBS7531900.1 zinc-binding dehydrogenase [Polycladospora coralii]
MANQIMIEKAGNPEVLVDQQSAPVQMESGMVRIDVTAAGVNFADVVGRLGNYPDAPPIPYCPGYEVAGVVTEVGEGVTHLQVGDRVCALTTFGGYTDEIVTRADGAFRLPTEMDLELSAAVPVTYLTAHTCLFDAGGLVPGKTVLLLGGAGGVGSAAIQLARQVENVTILATAGSKEKCEWMVNEGVHHAINYTNEDIAERVKEITNGRGVDLVLDPIGGRNLKQSVEMCGQLGRVVLFGTSSMSPSKDRKLGTVIREALPLRFFNLIDLFSRNVGIHTINMLVLSQSEPERTQIVMKQILAQIEAGKLNPVIAERFTLDAKGAREAHHYLQDRKNIGKVLLIKKHK